MAGHSDVGGSSGTNIENGKGNGLLLYFHHYSYYSQKVVMALHEKKLAFKTHVVNIMKGEQYQPWFLDINPRGEVPVLRDGVKIIPDSSRILDYLEDNFTNGSTPQLIPRDQGNTVRQRISYFRTLLDELPCVTITMGSFFHPDLVANPKLPFIAPVRRILAAAERKGAENLRKYAEQNPKCRDTLLQKANLHEKRYNTLTNRDEYMRVLTQVDSVLQKVEDQLASNSSGNPDWWLCSPNFTVADISLTILMDRLYRLGLENRFWSKGHRPYLTTYYERVQKRDSYRQTIPSTFVHFQLLVVSQTSFVVGTCLVGALAIILGGAYYFKRR